MSDILMSNRVPRDMYKGNTFASDNYGEIKILEYFNKSKVKVVFIDTGCLGVFSSASIRSGGIKDPSKGNLVAGVGVNDSDYPTIERLELPPVAGRRKRKVVWECPYYKRWANMLTRCYGGGHVSYEDCSVCKEWLTFSNFKAWMEKQDWEGKELDKDLLVAGNREYSPSTCLFIPREVNTFLVVSKGKDKKTLVGSHWVEARQRYICVITVSSRCVENLGSFRTKEEAHLTWKKRKHELACQLADKDFVTDIRVVKALRLRYKNFTVVEEELT